MWANGRNRMLYGRGIRRGGGWFADLTRCTPERNEAPAGASRWGFDVIEMQCLDGLDPRDLGELLLEHALDAVREG
jgi:hypothetical protein